MSSGGEAMVHHAADHSSLSNSTKSHQLSLSMQLYKQQRSHATGEAATRSGQQEVAEPTQRRRQKAAYSLEGFAKNIVCGAFSGVCNSAFSFPLDTIKVRAQAERGKLSYAAVVAAGWRAGGVRNFYRGVASPMVGVMCDNAAIFATNSNVLSFLEEATLHPDAPSYNEHNRPILHTCIAGLFAGVASGVVLTPFELVKCRMQLRPTAAQSAGIRAPTHPRSLSMRRVIHDVYHNEGGVMGFFQGCRAAVTREIPGTLTWLSTYQLLVAHWQQRHHTNGDSVKTLNTSSPPRPPMHVSVFAGGMAGVAYWTIAYPADTIKTRIQSGSRRVGGNSTDRPVGVFRAISEVVKTSGVRGLYRGYGITIIRAFPSNAILFSSYEFAASRWERAFPHQAPLSDLSDHR